MNTPASVTGAEYGFGIYIHWPYCTRICPYCDFNVYAAKTRDTGPLIEAICRDLVFHAERYGAAQPLGSIYFGGGTPSLIGASGLSRILETIHDLFGAPSTETTLEANPLDITASALADWKSLGIERLSLGVQSLREDALRFLGRDHSPDQARHAAEATLKTFPNTSVDLIYARPGQSIDDWEAELRETLDLGAPHLSLYELTIEERTAFGKRVARGELTPMDDDGQADLYELTQVICFEAGLPAYEVSNHAQGTPFESGHNRIYWNSGDWIGVGPGAHGRLTRNGQRLATQAKRRPKDYTDAAELAEPQHSVETLSPTDVARELISMGLRPATGLGRSRLREAGLDPAHETLERFAEDGLLSARDDRIALTDKGRLFADYIAARLAP
ncbi:MAG: radical SAM family heme chaperone HemW [Pseudomonadota bacterium]